MGYDGPDGKRSAFLKAVQEYNNFGVATANPKLRVTEDAALELYALKVFLVLHSKVWGNFSLLGVCLARSKFDSTGSTQYLFDAAMGRSTNRDAWKQPTPELRLGCMSLCGKNLNGICICFAGSNQAWHGVIVFPFCSLPVLG